MKTETQLTTVEWLEVQIKNTPTVENLMNQLDAFIKEAKIIEKKQREKDFVEGYKTRALASNLIFDEKSEYYAKTLFNRTYKTE
jgi:hypothetical protein